MASRFITPTEFKAAIVYGIQKGRIEDPSLAEISTSIAGIGKNSDAIIKDSAGKMLFSVSLSNLDVDESKVAQEIQDLKSSGRSIKQVQTVDYSALRRIDQAEFNAALKYGISKDRIDNPAQASFKDSSISGGDVIIKQKNGKILFSTSVKNLDIKYPDQEEGKSKIAKENKKLSKAQKNDLQALLGQGLSLVVFAGLVGFGFYFWKDLQRKQKQFVDSIDYSNPVRNYTYTNEIWDEYAKSKVLFNRDVQGKVVYVTGRIPRSCVQEDYVCIEGQGFDLMPPRIDCKVKNKNDLLKLQAGMTIKVAGIMNFEEGFLDDVSIRHCVISTKVDQRGGNATDFLREGLNAF